MSTATTLPPPRRPPRPPPRPPRPGMRPPVPNPVRRRRARPHRLPNRRSRPDRRTIPMRRPARTLPPRTPRRRQTPRRRPRRRPAPRTTTRTRTPATDTAHHRGAAGHVRAPLCRWDDGRVPELSTRAIPTLAAQLTDALGSAIATAYPEVAGTDPLIRPSDHADLQANAALALAKKVGAKPRDVAARVSEAITPGGAVGQVASSGPGFLNLTLSDHALWHQAQARRVDERLGVPASQSGVRTVIDYSGPNIAKEMHVGHIRSTVIGDCLVRVLSFLGSEVIK